MWHDVVVAGTEILVYKIYNNKSLPQIEERMFPVSILFKDVITKRYIFMSVTKNVFKYFLYHYNIKKISTAVPQYTRRKSYLI